MMPLNVILLDAGLEPDEVPPSPLVLGSLRSFVDDPLLAPLGHGTDMVAVLAQALASRGAPESVRLEVGRFISGRGYGTLAALTAALAWALELEPSVVAVPSGLVAPSPSLHRAVQALVRRGSVVVAAAGNLRAGQCRPLYPAAYPEVVAVGCAEHAAAYQTWRPPPDLLLPGTFTLSQRRPPRTLSGTSCATMQAAAHYCFCLSRNHT